MRSEVYPEVAAGGYTAVDGTLEFWTRVGALISDGDTVVELGAGRGAFLEDPVRPRREAHNIKPRCASLVGLDVDPAVLENPAVHQAMVIGEAGPFPLQDQSVDLLVSDWTFEHVRRPREIVNEIHRVLKPGGWVCARTPRKWGAIGIGARMVPNRLHNTALRRLQPEKKAVDTFPTAYRLNSMRALQGYFSTTEWEHHSYGYESEPAYVGNSRIALRAATVLSKGLPRSASSVLMVFIRKQ